MNTINLMEEAHMLVTNNDGSPMKDNESFWVMDKRDNTIFTVPDSPEVRKFFHLLPENITENCHLEDSNSQDNAAIAETIDFSSDKYGDYATWEHSAVMLLFPLRKEHAELFKNDKVRNEVVWKKIANAFKEKGYIYTAKQVENKWKNLRKNYMKIKDNNNKSGASFKKCKYFDEMEEIYGKSPNVEPVAIASNLSEKKMFFSTDEEENLDEDISAVPIKKTKMDKQLEMWTKYLDTNTQKREESRERRHKERIEQQKQALETYKEVMDKLLKKL